MRWINDLMRVEGEIEWAVQETKKEYDEIIIENGRRLKDIVFYMLNINRPLDEIVQITGFSLEEVQALQQKS
jgi:hypothetical protein